MNCPSARVEQPFQQHRADPTRSKAHGTPATLKNFLDKYLKCEDCMETTASYGMPRSSCSHHGLYLR